MPQSAGPNIAARPNLVFEYDTGDVQNSYKGEPTTNILYAGDPQLNDIYSWTNSGTWTTNDNDTTVPKPFVPGINTSGLLIMSGTTITVGSQQIGCAYYNSLTPSTTYTISLWFMQNRAGSNQPYFRTVVNNNSLGNFNYNGDTNAANWPVNQWIKISCTATIQANETGAFLSNYIGSAVGDKVWYFGPQLEQKSHATPLALGTRSNTQGLLDVSGKGNTIDLTNMSYTSTAQPTFDGTSNYTLITNSSILQIVDSITIESLAKINSSNLGNVKVMANKYYSTGWEFVLGTDGTFALGGRNGDGTYYSTNSGVVVADNKYHHLVGIKSGLYWQTYVDGVLKSTLTAGSIGTLSNSGDIQLGKEGSGYFTAMSLPIFRIYNNGLSSTQVQQNYNQLKSRFNLI